MTSFAIGIDRKCARLRAVTEECQAVGCRRSVWDDPASLNLMTLERYAYNVGSLVANLQSLEFALRAFLQKLPNARPTGIAYCTEIYSFPIGDELWESELTSYDSPGELIDKYNEAARAQAHVEIDRTLVDIRDALAHGRVSAEVTSDTLRLIKFSKPRNGRVRVTFNALLSEDWFSEHRRRIVAALNDVVSFL